MRLGLLVSDEMDYSHNAVGNHIGSVTVIVGTDKYDNNLIQILQKKEANKQMM